MKYGRRSRPTSGGHSSSGIRSYDNVFVSMGIMRKWNTTSNYILNKKLVLNEIHFIRDREACDHF